MQSSNIIQENLSIRNEDVEFNGDSYVFLGPNLRFTHCTINLKTTQAKIAFRGVEFYDCTIRTKQKLLNFQWWRSATIQGCRFEGHFSGNDFGSRQGDAVDRRVADCDFSNATLGGCRFFSCEPESIKFPRWPCYVVFNPHSLGTSLLSHEIEGDMKRLAEYFALAPAETTVLVDHYPSSLKVLNIQEENLKTLLGEIEGVRF